MNFYARVLSKFVAGKGLKIKIEVEVSQADGISEQKVEETKVALRELGLAMTWKCSSGPYQAS